MISRRSFRMVFIWKQPRSSKGCISLCVAILKPHLRMVALQDFQPLDGFAAIVTAHSIVGIGRAMVRPCRVMTIIEEQEGGF